MLPSFAEGLPVVIMEAFALGRPVLSTYVAGIPELVKDRENGWLVPAGSREALRDALLALMKTPVAELDRMAAKGREAVREQHYTPTETSKLAARLRSGLRALANVTSAPLLEVRPRNDIAAAPRAAAVVPLEPPASSPVRAVAGG